MKDEPRPPHLREVIGASVKRLREEGGWSQDALASKMTALGFPWRQSTVTEVEAGRRPLQSEELLALPIVFGWNLAELADHEGDWTEIGRRGLLVSKKLLAAILQSDIDSVAKGRNDEVLTKQGLLAFDDDEADRWDDATLMARRDAERRIASVLGVEPVLLAEAALSLWGHGLSEERDLRARESDDDSPAAKGHVTRAMLDELDDYLSKKLKRHQYAPWRTRGKK